jgi:Dolichyl-phosphate-mannose-protein mannosyltransferase
VLAQSNDRFRVLLVSACVALKIALILLDDNARLFLGDSGTYLWSAVSLQMPTDRSYTYPLFIRAVALPFASITPLLWAQTLCGVATAVMIAWLLRRVFAVRRCVALIAALLVTLDPMQLFYERMVMTESLSTCVLVASLCVAVAYVRSGRVGWLAACILLGVISASLRVGLVPLACCLGIAAVLARWDASRRAQVARHLMIAMILTFAMHDAYRYY